MPEIKKYKCALCKKEYVRSSVKEEDYFPFCSERCRLMDLGSWLKEEYVKVLSGERDVLFKLKEIWGYIGHDMAGFEKELKAIKKSTTLTQYETAVRLIARGSDTK